MQINDDYLLYGIDPTPNIVACEVLPGKENFVELFIREDGNVVSVYQNYLPFLLTKIDEPALGGVYGDLEYTPLSGENEYDVIVSSTNVGTLRWLAKNANNANLPMLQSQYLLLTGRTLFKGMMFDDPVRLYLDIEVYTTEGYEFPNSARKTDSIIVISMIDNRGNDWVLSGDDEVKLLTDFLQVFNEVNPDIVIGHNIFNFDIPYLYDRFKMHRMDFALGRNNTEPKFFDTEIKFAEKSKSYTNCQIYGRAVLDTMFLSMAYDVVKRELPGYGLKEVVKFLGRASEDREYVEGKLISEYWRTNRAKLLRYALDDVKETRVLDETFGQSTFFQTQMVPLGLQDVARYGTGTKIELWFLREYIRVAHSYPKPSPSRKFSGGLAGAPIKGLVKRRCVYADVGSLYPTLGEILGIHPRKDALNIYRPMNSLLKRLRFTFKDEAKRLSDLNDPTAEQWKAKESLVKILLNTLAYGYIGWEFGGFNDYDEAERITINGQTVLRKMIEKAEELGGLVVKLDTDGSLIALPDGIEPDVMINWLNDEVSAWAKEVYGDGGIITIGNDGVYESVLILDKKSYVLFDGKKIKPKGSTLRNRRMEPVALNFLKDSIDKIMRGSEVDEIVELYEYYCFMCRERLLTVDDISKKENINKSLEEYRNHVSAGRCNRSSVYEVAMQLNRRFEKGDSISYYITEPPMETVLIRKKEVTRKAKLKAFESAKSVKLYDNDYDIDYYLKRLASAAKKLAVVYGPETFTDKFGIKLNKKDLSKFINDEDTDDDNDEDDD
jgi:DNA polymerase elongation subunit (family B)